MDGAWRNLCQSTLDLYLFGYSAKQLSWSFTFVLEPSELSPLEANDVYISSTPYW